MIVKLSSKGQLVIPQEIRQALNLKPGTELEVALVHGRIMIQPIMDKAKLDELVAALRQLSEETNLLDDLEAEHREEIEREQRLEQSLRAG